MTTAGGLANPKSFHHSAQLYAALTRGAWGDKTPGKALNGSLLTWSDTLCKVRKHCRDLNVLAEIAFQTQGLSLLLLPSKDGPVTAADLDGDAECPDGPLLLGSECILAEERKEEARAGYEALEKLYSQVPHEKESLTLARAYFAYALGLPNECLSILSDLEYTPPPATVTRNGTIASAIVPSASLALSVPGGSISSGTSRTSFGAGSKGTWGSHSTITDSQIHEGRIWWVVERLRGFCLQGMLHELSSNLHGALASYESALPLLDQLSLPKAPSPSERAKADSTIERHREFWRWAERLLWRACIVSSKTRSVEQTLSLLRQYASLTMYYPPTFRPSHRHTIFLLHYRALMLHSPFDPEVKSTQTKLAWITEARTLIDEYRLVLNVTTKFPKAGERNRRVEEFVDACVAIWERSGMDGKEAGWVIEILWWATRLTFHSHRITRYLTRLLHVNGQHDLAKRTLNLYVQLVTKARQADISDVEVQVRKRRTLNQAVDVDEEAMNAALQELEKHAITGGDSDRDFVETLILGARMLCRLEGGLDEIKVATNCMELARQTLLKDRTLRSDRTLSGRLNCAEGIVHTVTAIRAADPQSRTSHLQAAVHRLQSSIETDPSSADAQYHLGLALSMAGPSRDIPNAVLAARQAVERNPKEIRYWHLLGLLLCAENDFKGARAVLELGEFEDGEDEGIVTPIQGPARPVNGNSGLNGPITGELQRTESPDAIETLVFPTDAHLPPPGKLRLPLPDHPPPTREQRFEHGLQLRMTLLAVIEMVEGAESAGLKWVQVFAWFAEKGGWAASGEEKRQSLELPPMETHRPPTIEIPPMDNTQAHETAGTGDEIAPTDEASLELTRSRSPSRPPIPIALIPPTPGESVESSKEKDPKEQDVSARKKAQRLLKEHVHKGQHELKSLSKKISKGGTIRSGRIPLTRSNSAPDFHAVLSHAKPYQASSIHSRRRISSPLGSYIGKRASGNTTASVSPPPPPVPPLPPAPTATTPERSPREKRLLSDLWLTSAATFRRMGKIEQAKAAIQEAEVLDEENPGVWVQLGLYFTALDNRQSAIEAFHKALVFVPDYVPALVHLSQQYLTPFPSSAPDEGTIDLAAGILSNVTRGAGWDVPEAWYLLAKASGLQGRRERERECLSYALGLVEGRGVRASWEAVGGCL